MAQSKIGTTTVLSLTTSAGTQTSSVASGTVVTLTAKVTPASGAIKAGQVKFCDASVSGCTDIHLFGIAQLTSSGKATTKLRPGIGTHSYKAVFVGTKTEATSASGGVPLTVTGIYPSSTTITQSGIPNDYSLTATVTGIANSGTAPAPSGSVLFEDTSNKNAVLGNAPLGTLTPALTFFNVSNPPTVPEPNVTVAADFNGDGILDLAVSNSNSGGTTLSVLLGNGDGTFTATTVSPTVGLYPDAIIAADFNGDGIPDLAVTSVDQNLVTILLGHGDGTFTVAPNLNTISTPQDVQTGDFNGDGIPDLAVVNANSALIFLGNGDGTFTQSTSSPSVSGTPIKIAVADFNNDGILDLALTNQLPNVPVQIFLGKGDGTFTAATTNPSAGTTPVGIAAGDFNGDGNLDLAVTQYGADSAGAVAILLGNGNGTFKPAVFYAGYGIEYESVVIADFNGDGIPDLMLGQFWSEAGTLLLGKGDGTFEAGQPVVDYVPATSGYLAVADFNGDGVPDLAVPSQNIPGAIAILLTQNSQVQTATLNNVAATGPGPHQVVAQYNGDSHYLPSTSTATALLSQVATPVLSVAQGNYTSVQTLTITDSTPGATIYYRESGVQSTFGFVAYTGPLSIYSQGQTSFQIYASETGYQDSNYVDALYTLNLPATAAPKISLAAGYYPTAQTVTLTDSVAEAKIYYTTDGALPTPYSNLYSGPITVSSSETLVAAALASGYSISASVSAQYVIGSAQASLIYTVAGTGNVGYSGNGGPAILADVNGPTSVVQDSNGNLYIAEYLNHVVRKVASGTGVISVFAGTGTIGDSGDGGPATEAELSTPYSLAMDNLGNLFIADYGTIRKVNLSSGIISTYAGSLTATGPGDGGPATSAYLGDIGEIAIDASGNVFLAEPETASIREIDNATGVIHTVAGTGVYDYSGDGGAASSATFRNPMGLAFDANGNLYVADSNNYLIRKITAVDKAITGSSIISTVAGTAPTGGSYPQAGYSGDGGPATSASLNDPLSVRVDSSGNLYISDANNGAIRRVLASNNIISTIAGNGVNCGYDEGDGGSATSGNFCTPSGIAIDKAGDVYVADYYFERIREVMVAAKPPSTQAAAPVFSLSAGTYNSSQILTISDATPGASIYVTVDGSAPTTANSQGYGFPIPITGHTTVQAVATAPGYLTSGATSASYTVTSPSPTISTVAGNGTFGSSLSSGPALSTAFGYLQGVAVDKAGNLYLSDATNNVIWLVSATTGIASVFAGNGTIGYQGNGGPATSASLTNPQGIALDSDGNLYIADSDNSVIRKVTATTGIISTYAGDHSWGYSGDGGPANWAALYQPFGVAVDSANNVYIADSNNFRIREVTATTGIITTVAGNGRDIDSGDGGPATQAGLEFPQFVTVDSAGNFYISYLYDSSVRKVTASTGIITTVAGDGKFQGQFGDNGPATSAQIDVQGLSVDTNGNLYIANRIGEIREVNATTGTITQVAGIGFGGFSGDGGAATAAEISGPTGMAFDQSGNLFFADVFDDRVRKVTALSIVTATLTPATLTFPTTAVGSTSAAQVLTLKNTGNTAMKLNGVHFAGTDASSFLQSGTSCPGSLAAGASCTIGIAFKPASAGTLTANCSLTDSATNSPQTIALSGTGAVGLTATLAPASLTFETTAVGSTSAAQVLTLTNTSSATMSLSGVRFTGADASSFLQSGTNCPGSLAGGASCSISIKFKPASSGTLSAAYSLSDTATNSPQTVALSGAGSTNLTVTLTPSALTFPSTTVGSTSAAQVLTFTNTSSATINLGGAGFTGTDASSFFQSGTSCPGTLVAGASCTIGIKFKPASSGALSAAYSLTDTASNSPQSVALSGTGTP